MTTLLQAAEAARKDEATRRREEAKARREAFLDRIIETWHDEKSGCGYTLSRLRQESGLPIPVPDREDFVRIANPQIRKFETGHNAGHVHGYSVTVDELNLLFSEGQYSGSIETRLVHTCPGCGVTGASDFHGLRELAELTKNGPPSWRHRCVEAETRDVAYAIASAARDLEMPVAEVVAEALDRHADLIRRLRT